MATPQKMLDSSVTAKMTKKALGPLGRAPKLSKKQEELYGYMLGQITNLNPAAARYFAQYLSTSGAATFPEAKATLLSSFELLHGLLPELRFSSEYMSKNGSQRLFDWNAERKKLDLCIE